MIELVENWYPSCYCGRKNRIFHEALILKKIIYVFNVLCLDVFIKSLINPFHANVPFLYPLETLESLWFSDVFRGMEMGHWREKGEPNISEEITLFKILTSYEFFISKLHPKIFGLSTWFFTTFIHEIY